MSEIIKNQKLGLVITFVVSFLVILEYYFPVGILVSSVAEVKVWSVVIAYFMLFIGAAVTCINHLKTVNRRTKDDWPYSVYSLLIIFIMIVLGIGLSPESTYYKWIINNMYGSSLMGVLCLTAFYVFASAFRLLTIRTWESLILVLASFLIMMKNVPIGEVIWSGFPIISDWMTNTIQRGAYTGLIMTIGMGSMIMGILTIIGRQRRRE